MPSLPTRVRRDAPKRKGLIIRLTDEEKREAAKHAKAKGLPLAVYVRERAVNEA